MLQGYSGRAIRVGDSNPTISVLLTSAGQRGDLEACLERLVPVCKDLEAQLVVVRAYNDEELVEMRRAFPAVQFTAAPAGSSVADLRAIGMVATEGDVVVLGEDRGISTDELVERFSYSRRTEQVEHPTND